MSHSIMSHCGALVARSQSMHPLLLSHKVMIRLLLVLPETTILTLIQTLPYSVALQLCIFVADVLLVALGDDPHLLKRHLISRHPL